MQITCDIAAIENNMKEVKLSCRKLIKTTEKVDLLINDNKIEHIILNKKEVNCQQNEVVKVKKS